VTDQIGEPRRIARRDVPAAARTATGTNGRAALPHSMGSGRTEEHEPWRYNLLPEATARTQNEPFPTRRPPARVNAK
jgi:hypothetical protein